LQNPTEHSALSLAGTVVVIVAVLWLTLSGLCTAGWMTVALWPVNNTYGLYALFYFVLPIGGGAIAIGLIALWVGRVMERKGQGQASRAGRGRRPPQA
jgi:apolipoprotein N-acyltransferase